MTDFTYQGIRYRIVFRHSPSRVLGDHAAHDVYIHRFKNAPPAVCCATCRAIYKMDGPFKLTNLSRADRRRYTTCVIMRQVDGKWEVATTPDGVRIGGLGVPHSKLDEFNRRAGCRAALADALAPRTVSETRQAGPRLPLMDAEFRALAWAAYRGVPVSAPRHLITELDNLDPILKIVADRVETARYANDAAKEAK